MAHTGMGYGLLGRDVAHTGMGYVWIIGKGCGSHRNGVCMDYREGMWLTQECDQKLWSQCHCGPDHY